MANYFTSDTHFGLRLMAILRGFAPAGAERDDVTPEMMEAHDESNVAAWNSTVGPDGTVWHLGDLTLKRPGEIAPILARLPHDPVQARSRYRGPRAGCAPRGSRDRGRADVRCPGDGGRIRTGAGYNLAAYVVIPLLYFRRRYTAEQLSLRSSDRRADALLVAVVLVIESAVQLLLNPAILALSPRQILLGAPLTFALSLAGTALPTMVFVACILLPRYLRLTGSVPATVILGGLTYAALHITDGWTEFSSPTDALLSVLFVFLYYTGPGMFKSFITIRSANAWVHMWAYHAIAPHTLMDTPMFVRVFGIR